MEKNNKMTLEEAAKDLHHLIKKHIESSLGGNDIMNLKDLMQTPEFEHFEQAVNPVPTKGDFIKWIEHFTHKSWVEEDQKIARHLIAYLKTPQKTERLVWIKNNGVMPLGYKKAIVQYKQGDYGVVNIKEMNWSIQEDSIASIERFLIIE